jgi:hypothetical protein
VANCCGDPNWGAVGAKPGGVCSAPCGLAGGRCMGGACIGAACHGWSLHRRRAWRRGPLHRGHGARGCERGCSRRHGQRLHARQVHLVAARRNARRYGEMTADLRPSAASTCHPRTDTSKPQWRARVLNGHGPQIALRPVLYPGTDLLSPYDYHRPQGLNFRVRDGIGCGPLGKGTGNSQPDAGTCRERLRPRHGTGKRHYEVVKRSPARTMKPVRSGQSACCVKRCEAQVSDIASESCLLDVDYLGLLGTKIIVVKPID